MRNPDFIGDQEACIAYLRKEIAVMRKIAARDIARVYFTGYPVEVDRSVTVTAQRAPSGPDGTKRWALYIKR